MASPIFTLTLRVPETDIDPQGHVNNVAFLRYVQEAAIAHWRSAAPRDLQEVYTWVVRKHEIEYFRPGLPGDELQARTWGRRAFERDVGSVHRDRTIRGWAGPCEGADGVGPARRRDRPPAAS